MYFTKPSLMSFSKVNIKLEYLICGEEIMYMRGVRNLDTLIQVLTSSEVIHYSCLFLFLP